MSKSTSLSELQVAEKVDSLAVEEADKFDEEKRKFHLFNGPKFTRLRKAASSIFQKKAEVTENEEDDDSSLELHSPSTPVYSTWKATKLQDSGLIQEEDTNHSRGSSASTAGTKYKISHNSNSAKLGAGAIAPKDFEKIKIIGKGDVGKVFLVRSKLDEKLFAMKGFKTIN